MPEPIPGARGSDRARKPDLLCFSHLRWNFVYQRPQHLMSRFARDRRVFYWEEPVHHDAGPWLQVTHGDDGVTVIVPHLPSLDAAEAEPALRRLLDGWMEETGIGRFVAWFYTPMALGWAGHLDPLATVYDCMDELSAFRFAPAELLEREAQLMFRADLVFTGGSSLYEARRDRHPSVHLFPSSIDADHFAAAREPREDPADQAGIPHPRIGFFGVLDERFDAALVRALAAARPEWHIVLIGPVCKVDPADLPHGDNLHYLGPKSYADLPAYIAGWDVAALFFAMNESTRFISPTKTPEYLAAGKRTVSSPVRDVVRAWGDGLVAIAATPEEWVDAVVAALADEGRAEWLDRVDARLARSSWESTWAGMDALIDRAAEGRLATRTETRAMETERATERDGFAAAAGD
ncbi:glycosyltransferase [Longimicrobium sp.]|uniref:glycosyltransferase n=1 Tax=Longimicrobium sp. TaxID=2029185 RepID=UPI003B3A23B6